MTEKERLRRFSLRKIRALRSMDRRKRSLVIQRRLLASAVYRKARAVLFYCSRPDEVGTRFLIREALRNKKRVFLPRCGVTQKMLQIFQIKNIARDLKKGCYGILEPVPARTRRARVSELGLVVVPGVAFDKAGFRVGRGAGYYDRFLKRLPRRIKKIGLAFSFQVFSKVPCERHDVKVDRVLTD